MAQLIVSKASMQENMAFFLSNWLVFGTSTRGFEFNKGEKEKKILLCAFAVCE